MEHLCHGCGAGVEDSAPFCGSCGVPQVRFSAREPGSEGVVARASAPAASVSSSFSASDVSPPAVSLPSYGQLEAPNQRRTGGLNRQAELRSALNAGAIAAVASLIPLAFFLAAPLAGYFGVRFYQRRGGMPEPSARAGFKFGALVGLFASPIFAVLRGAQIVASGTQGEMRQAMEKLQQAAANSPYPWAHQFANYLSSPHGIVVFIVLGLVFVCLAFVLLAGMGGAISASLVRRKS